MDVEKLIEHAVLSLRHEAGFRLSRDDRKRLEHLRRYLEWRIRFDDDLKAYQLALWGDDEDAPLE